MTKMPKATAVDVVKTAVKRVVKRKPAPATPAAPVAEDAATTARRAEESRF